MIDTPHNYHIPVLTSEVLYYLALKPGGVYLDATFGGGGHTRAILNAEPTCKVIAFDWDKRALELNGEPLAQEYPDRLTLIWGNFAYLDKYLKKIGVTNVDGILADFGTSQYQLSQAAGFSFYHDSPLDMRMSPAHQKVTAREVVNKASEKALADIFYYLGEELQAKKIARIIVEERKKQRIDTTRQLALIIERIVKFSGKRKIHPATKVFQALRIYVNHELDNIVGFLSSTIRILNPGGRLVCISFHSLEDRLVKQFFKKQAEQHSPVLSIVTSKVVVASKEEIQRNPSSRSAKLRAAEKVGK